jgi:hypothetical protein
MQKAPDSLHRLPPSVAKVMFYKCIRNRGDLAKRCGISPTTVYSAFDSKWSGHASGAMFAKLPGLLGVPMNALVEEPAAERRKLRKAGLHK